MLVNPSAEAFLNAGAVGCSRKYHAIKGCGRRKASGEKRIVLMNSINDGSYFYPLKYHS